MANTSLCAVECLACLGGLTFTTDNSGGNNSSIVTVVVTVLVGVALGIFNAVLKFPRVQRFIGAENTAKVAKLDTILNNTDVVARAAKPNEPPATGVAPAGAAVSAVR